MPANFPEAWLNRVIQNLNNADQATFLEVVVFAKDWQKRNFKAALNGISNYFKESAIRKDVYLCSEYRTLWNCTLRTKQGKKIGVNNRTLSADLGEQDYNGTMSKTGATLNLILFLIERNHSRKAYGK